MSVPENGVVHEDEPLSGAPPSGFAPVSATAPSAAASRVPASVSGSVTAVAHPNKHKSGKNWCGRMGGRVFSRVFLRNTSARV
jgi:hypothetical protein